MKYLLILFVLALVLSPLAWLKTSPGQRRATEFRRRAATLGMRVQLVPAVDADEQDKRPTAVRYLLPVVFTSPLAQWRLFRSERRGWESPWSGWRWLRGEAEPSLHPALAAALRELPASVNAIGMDREGVSVYWDERGDIEDVECIHHCLDRLRRMISSRNNSDLTV